MRPTPNADLCPTECAKCGAKNSFQFLMYSSMHEKLKYKCNSCLYDCYVPALDAPRPKPPKENAPRPPWKPPWFLHWLFKEKAP